MHHSNETLYLGMQSQETWFKQCWWREVGEEVVEEVREMLGASFGFW